MVLAVPIQLGRERRIVAVGDGWLTLLELRLRADIRAQRTVDASRGAFDLSFLDFAIDQFLAKPLCRSTLVVSVRFPPIHTGNGFASGCFPRLLPRCRIAYAQGCRIDMARCSFETSNFSFPLSSEPLDRDADPKTTRFITTAAPTSYGEHNSTIARQFEVV
jgi:hypothetical protein